MDTFGFVVWVFVVSVVGVLLAAAFGSWLVVVPVSVVVAAAVALMLF